MKRWQAHGCRDKTVRVAAPCLTAGDQSAVSSRDRCVVTTSNEDAADLWVGNVGNTPPLINEDEICNTPPSPLCKLKLCRNVSCADDASKIPNCGESRYLSLIKDGSLTHAAFGVESAGGGGSPGIPRSAIRSIGVEPIVAVHPAGSAGGVRLSKFSLNKVIGWPEHCRGSVWPSGSASVRSEKHFAPIP